MVHRQNQAKSDQNIVPKQSGLTTHKAQPIMIMGTSSGAGKSTLAIGLCRVLARRGYVLFAKLFDGSFFNLIDAEYLILHGCRQIS